MINKWIYDIAEIESAAAKLITVCDQSHIICLDGEMGAGKTTLSQSICNQWGCSEAISSPTFAIINQYESQKGTIHHADLYRLNHPKDLIDIGLEDILFSGDICIIEWYQIARDIIPLPYYQIRLDVIDATHRAIEIELIS